MGKTSNLTKYKLLGMHFGTASNQLRKAILFQLIKETKRNNCFRCKEIILKIVDLSIEHKESWQMAKNPIESFFNIENIAFSHLRCNIKEANKDRQKILLQESNDKRKIIASMVERHTRQT